MKGLKDETHALGAHQRTPVLIELREIGAVEVHMPTGRQVESGEQGQKRRLARP